jgi:hypothetical protein
VPTFLTDVDVAAATLQNVVPVSSITHLATEAPPRRTINNALKASRLLALVVLLEFVADFTDSSDPLACALFPADATELDLAGASAIS